MTGETPEVRSDKRKPREDRQNHRYHRYNRYHGYHRYHKYHRKIVEKNYIYWQKCSKSQKVGAHVLVAHFHYKISCWSYQINYLFSSNRSSLRYHASLHVIRSSFNSVPLFDFFFFIQWHFFHSAHCHSVTVEVNYTFSRIWKCLSV